MTSSQDIYSIQQGMIIHSFMVTIILIIFMDIEKEIIEFIHKIFFDGLMV